MFLLTEWEANLYLRRHSRYLARRRREGRGPLPFSIKGIRCYHLNDLVSWAKHRR
jgi:hypothetical protein